MRAIKRIEDSRKFRFPKHILAMIKKDQTYLPQAARTSKKVSLAVLRSNRGNYCCLFHFKKDKSGNLKNSLNPAATRGRGKYKIMGVYGDRRFVKRKGKNALAKQPLGILNCGCKQLHAFWDLYIWKTWRVSEIIKEVDKDGKAVLEKDVEEEVVVESLEDDVLEPRLRLFVIKQLKRTGMQMSHFLRGSKSKLHAKMDATLDKIYWHVNRYNRMVLMNEEDTKFCRLVLAGKQDVKMKDFQDLQISDSETGSVLAYKDARNAEEDEDDSGESDSSSDESSDEEESD